MLFIHYLNKICKHKKQFFYKINIKKFLLFFQFEKNVIIKKIK